MGMVNKCMSVTALFIRRDKAKVLPICMAHYKLLSGELRYDFINYRIQNYSCNKRNYVKFSLSFREFHNETVAFILWFLNAQTYHAL